MLSFGLSLLGGCVATTATGQPSELYFPSHDILAPRRGSSVKVFTPNVATELNMSAAAHIGVFIAENVVKTGRRASYEVWGIFGDAENGQVKHNSLNLTMCARNWTQAGSYSTNVNHVSALYEGQGMGAQPPLYQSGMGVTSPRFMMTLADSVLHVTDSFSGQEKTTSVPLLYGIAASSQIRTSVMLWNTNPEISYDFVVASYTNEGLGLHQLTLPMRALPKGFNEGATAVFEYQYKRLIEL